MNIDEISEGLKLAMSRGESLEQAMESFSSSGYSKQDIQQASVNLSSPVQIQAPQVPSPGMPAIPQPTLQPLQSQPTQAPSQPIQTPVSQPLQQNTSPSTLLQSPQIPQPLQSSNPPQSSQPLQQTSVSTSSVTSPLSSQPLSPQTVQPVVQYVQPLPMQNQVVVPSTIPAPIQIAPQIASGYGFPQEQVQKNPRDMLIVLIIALLFILAITTAVIIIFREAIINFFNDLF